MSSFLSVPCFAFFLHAMVMYFWLNYCDENHIERIPIAMKNVDQLFHLASEIMEADRLHLLSLSDGTQIDDSLEIK